MNSRYLKASYWLDWIYPNRCSVCQRIIDWDKYVCKECENQFEFLDDLRIYKDVNEYESAYALMKYHGKAVDAIHYLKWENQLGFAKYGAEKLGDYLTAIGLDKEIDCICYVPMHWKNRIRRGYNQAEKIAFYISKKLNKPLLKRILVHKKSIAQHKLSEEERYKNAENSFEIKSNVNLHGKNILLCDDIITTGATINKCSRLLKSSGSGKIYAAAICSTELE
ncbi:MAG: ComF family protein [Oscillospiraceae bacterium]